MYLIKYFDHIYGNTWRQRRLDAPVRAANDAGINDSEAKQQYAAIYYALRKQDHIFEQKGKNIWKRKYSKCKPEIGTLAEILKMHFSTAA